MRLALATTISVTGVLVAANPVASHIGVTPGLLGAGDTETLSLTVHNDLDRPMTGLSVMAPAGVQIVRAGGMWEAVVENGTATWTGAPLAPNTGGTFEIELAVDASTPVGPLQLQAEQLYPGGGSLPWPIPVTVIPGSAVGKASLEPFYIPGLVLTGLLVLVVIAVVAWLKRRSGSSLQEQ